MCALLCCVCTSKLLHLRQFVTHYLLCMRFSLPFNSLIDKENEPYQNPVTMLSILSSAAVMVTQPVCFLSLFSKHTSETTAYSSHPTAQLFSFCVGPCNTGVERGTIDLVTSAHILLGGYTQDTQRPWLCHIYTHYIYSLYKKYIYYSS